MRKKEIMLAVQDKLKTSVSELKYIDKDWGQLDQEHPAVGFPCALLDIDNVEYSQIGQGYQMAEATFTVTVANVRTKSSSANAPSPEASYATIDLTEKINGVLHTFSTGDFAPLIRLSFRKVPAGPDHECYVMTYRTSYKCTRHIATTRIESVKINISEQNS